jgi:type IV secretory pathway TrbL component
MDPSILQKIITGFEQALDPGLAALRLLLLFWLAVMVFLELVRVTQNVLLDGHRADHLGKFAIKTGIFLYAYAGVPTIMTELIQGFVQMGLHITGDHITVQQFLDPGSLLAVGIQTGKVLKDITLANAGILGAVYFLPFLACWVLFILAYAVMAVNVFLLQIEIALAMPVALVALVFLFWQPTRTMASGVLSYGLNVCFRFMVQAMLASIIFTLGPILAPPITTSTAFGLAIEQALIMVIAAGVLAFLFLSAQRMVGNLLAGAPTLTTGGLLQTGAGVAGMVIGGGMVTRAALTHGARGGACALQTLSGGRLAVPMPAPPPVPISRAVHQTLRSGAQYLSHDQTPNGPRLPL